MTKGSLASSQGSFQREEMWELQPQTPSPEQSCWFRLGNNEQEPFGGVWKEQEEAGTGTVLGEWEQGWGNGAGATGTGEWEQGWGNGNRAGGTGTGLGERG